MGEHYKRKLTHTCCVVSTVMGAPAAAPPPAAKAEAAADAPVTFDELGGSSGESPALFRYITGISHL